jgi:hypothetical protein
MIFPSIEILQMPGRRPTSGFGGQRNAVRGIPTAYNIPLRLPTDRAMIEAPASAAVTIGIPIGAPLAIASTAPETIGTPTTRQKRSPRLA